MSKPMVIITGPTAAGKTDLSLRLAKAIGGEIISAESMQVYRGMDIGTAKILPDQMMGSPHHLIDIMDPDQPFNVMIFRRLAMKAAEDILSRGHIPIVTGGTGFYIQALLYGIDFTEMNADTDYRSSLEEEAQALGSQALYSRLQEIDPEAAEAIHPNNVKRIIRALEFAQKSGGQLISEHNRREHMRTPAYNAVFFVFNMDREKLYERIDARVDRMMQAGLVEEVTRLRAQGLTAEDVSMQGIGYRQILRALDGEYPMEEAVRLIKRDSRHFAKRQLTWFRRESGVTWIDLDEYPDQEELLNFMEETIRTKLQL